MVIGIKFLCNGCRRKTIVMGATSIARATKLLKDFCWLTRSKVGNMANEHFCPRCAEELIKHAPRR